MATAAGGGPRAGMNDIEFFDHPPGLQQFGPATGIRLGREALESNLAQTVAVDEMVGIQTGGRQVVGITGRTFDR